MDIEGDYKRDGTKSFCIWISTGYKVARWQSMNLTNGKFMRHSYKDKNVYVRHGQHASHIKNYKNNVQG